jgi:hypothetical protein
MAELCATAQDAFQEKMHQVFQDLFDLEPGKLRFYSEVFAGKRYESALLVYYAKLCTLKSEEKPALVELFKRFISAALSPASSEYYATRYSLSSSRHLATIFVTDAACDPTHDLALSWKIGESLDLSAFIAEKNIEYREYTPDFLDFFNKKIFKHHHLDISYYGFLNSYFDARNDSERQMAKDMAIQKKRKQETVNAVTVEQQLDRAHALIQVALMDLLELPIDPTRTWGIEKYRAHVGILHNIMKLLRQIPKDTAISFRHDIECLVNALKSRPPVKAKDWEEWTVTDTDDSWSMFMAGTDVEGSCQSVDGDPTLNKCLLAYVMDGKNRLLAIQNNEGKTVARCILRILWDSENNQPILFMEEIYPDNVRSDFRLVLQYFAIQRAQKLGLTLLTAESTLDSHQYRGRIESLGSIAPCEYVDALYDNTNGTFVIPAAQVIFDPKLPKPDLAARFAEATVTSTAGCSSAAAATAAEDADPESSEEDKWLVMYDWVTKMGSVGEVADHVPPVVRPMRLFGPA